jgi:hypothetical protein
MSRLGKQLVYGSLFLLFFILLGIFVYYFYIRPEPGCFNGRKDRGEEGIDCGGPCAAVCLPSDLKPLEMLGEPRLFPSSPTKLGILIKIQNPNLEMAVKSFNYRIDVYDAGGRVLTSRLGNSFIYAGEIKYVAEFAEVANSKDAVRATFTLEKIDWLPAARYPFPQIAFQEKRTEVRDEFLVASGKFLNQDLMDFPRVEVIAVFYNRFGLPAGVSKTEVENVKIGEPRAFNVIYPFSDLIDTAKTEYFAYARRI